MNNQAKGSRQRWDILCPAAEYRDIGQREVGGAGKFFRPVVEYINIRQRRVDNAGIFLCPVVDQYALPNDVQCIYSLCPVYPLPVTSPASAHPCVRKMHCSSERFYRNYKHRSTN